MNGFSAWAYDANLLILVGTFSEDMITTGISFSLDDSCMQESHSVICIYDDILRMLKSEEKKCGSTMRVRTLTFLRSSYPVISGIQ